MEISEIGALKGLSVRQELFTGRTGRTKCGVYLLASSLAAALHAERRVLARQGGRVKSLAFLSILRGVRVLS